MKIWRVLIKDEANSLYAKTIHGTAVSYEIAAEKAKKIARNENPNNDNLFVDEVSCYGEKDF